MLKKNSIQTLWIIFFVAPGLFVISVIILYPLFASLYNSFFSWNGFIRGNFSGLENFRSLFTQFPYNQRFFNAIGNNVK